MLSYLKITVLFSFSIITLSASAQLTPVGSGVFHWNDFAVTKNTGRESRKFLKGSTNELDLLDVHATTQQKGAAPKPPHAQKDIEELIIIREGSMKCTIGNKVVTLGKGSVLLIPPTVMQAFQNVGDGPLTYYVFQFRAKNGMDLQRSDSAGGALLINADTLKFKASEKGGGIKYFDRPTATTNNFEMHITKLNTKGPSHAPHQHIETEIMLIIDGQTEAIIDGQTYTAGPGDFYIAESGKMHGISNASDKPCSYFAFKWR